MLYKDFVDTIEDCEGCPFTICPMTMEDSGGSTYEGGLSCLKD